MIKMAGIVPQNYLELTQKADVHMALAHLIGEPGYENYTQFFKKKRKAGSFLILDNGVIEGSPMAIDDILDRAELIKADEIVLPDAYKDCAGTINMIRESLQTITRRYGSINDCPYRLMIVPQGESEEEWLLCATRLIELYGDDINTIGIPKHLIDTMHDRDARLKVLYQLMQECPEDINKFDIHLLGCWKTPIEVLTVAKAAEQGVIPMVRSCDSAIPYVYARAGLRFCDDDRPDKDPIDFKDDTCDELQLKINLIDWNNIGTLKANNIIQL